MFLDIKLWIKLWRNFKDGKMIEKLYVNLMTAVIHSM